MLLSWSFLGLDVLKSCYERQWWFSCLCCCTHTHCICCVHRATVCVISDHLKCSVDITANNSPLACIATWPDRQPQALQGDAECACVFLHRLIPFLSLTPPWCHFMSTFQQREQYVTLMLLCWVLLAGRRVSSPASSQRGDLSATERPFAVTLTRERKFPLSIHQSTAGVRDLLHVGEEVVHCTRLLGVCLSVWQLPVFTTWQREEEKSYLVDAAVGAKHAALMSP